LPLDVCPGDIFMVDPHDGRRAGDWNDGAALVQRSPTGVIPGEVHGLVPRGTHRVLVRPGLRAHGAP
jgi:hypothetical protein